MILTDEIKDFKRRLDALYHYLKIEDKITAVHENELLEYGLHARYFFNPEKFEKITGHFDI